MPITYSKKIKGIDLTKYSEVEIYELVLNGTIGRFPPDFWNCDEVNSYAPQITKHLLEEKLKWSKEDIKENDKPTGMDDFLRKVGAIDENGNSLIPKDEVSHEEEIGDMFKERKEETEEKNQKKEMEKFMDQLVKM